MGYYSIYKIIKDIIRTIFGSKFLKFTIIVLIGFTILFIMGEKSFASSSIPIDNSYVITNTQMDNSHQYSCIIRRYISNQYLYGLYYCDVPFEYIVLNNGSYKKIAPSVSGNLFYFPSGSDGLELPADYESWTRGWATNTDGSRMEQFQATIVYSNHDIYDNNGNLFHPSDAYQNPSFYNKTNFVDFSDDSLVIYPNDFDISDNLYLHFLTVDSTVTDDNNTIYYYAQRTFVLNSNSKYFNTINNIYYYNLPRYIFSLEANKQYIFFLSDNDDQINNSVGLYDYSNEYDGFTLSPTSQQITPTDTIIDNQQNQNNSINNIDDFINNDNVDDSTNDDIDDTLQFDTSNNATNFVTGFFSNISDLFVSLSDYNLEEVTTVNLPIPFTSSVLSLRSDLLSSHIDSNLIQIITLFWYFLFGMYYIKFMIAISKSITTGDAIVGTVKVPEVITDDVL